MEENDQIYAINGEVRGLLNKKYGITEFEPSEIINRLMQENTRMEEELKELLEKYQMRTRLELDAFTIGDAVSEGICVVDKRGIVTAVSKGYTEITGIKEEEIVGKYVRDMLDRKFFSCAVSLSVLKEKKQISSLTTIRNGKKVLTTANPFLDEKGEVIEVVTVMRDLTELVKLKEKLERAERKSEEYLKELNFIKEIHLNSEMVGSAPSIQRIREVIQHVAQTDATVLITGETGVGKEVIAKEIYKKSNRKNEKFIKINCAAIPETLLESELFGYEKGAFTGAEKKTKIGLFELADHGTLLLDEIGEMPIILQSKLLRVLQEKEITRLGGTNSIKIDIRLIAATNRNLEAQIKKGIFREDLFYRLNVVPIAVPPLRERKEDITLLAYSIIEKFNKKYNRNKSFEASAMNILQQYEWPGNVRELENVIERSIIIETDDLISDRNILNIIGQDMPAEGFSNYESMSLRSAVDLLEKGIIERALKKYKSTYKAAEVLGVTQPTIVRKAQALGIKK